MVKIKAHYIQIEARERRVTTAYRYYGLGQWTTKRHSKWEPINDIYIPALVLKVAALYCEKKRPTAQVIIQSDGHGETPARC